MKEKVSINKLENDRNNQQLEEGDSVFLDFLEFAGTDLEELKNITQYEDLKAKNVTIISVFLFSFRLFLEKLNSRNDIIPIGFIPSQVSSTK